MGSSRSSARTVRAVGAAALLCPAVARAQPVREVRGAITHATAAGTRPLSGAWVTLHRVGTDGAGPVDSVRTGGDGAYRFRYRVTGDTNALYFVSSRFAAIAYFTPPLRQPVVSGPDAELVVYDTTSAPVPIRIRGRHLVLMAPDSAATRRVVEVFELSNDTSVTRVAAARDGATWETALPDGARDLRAGDGEVSGDRLEFAGGRARVVAPIAPGVKQLSFNYRLPAGRAPMAFPSLGAATALEVLLEDERGSVSGAGLREAQAATVNGRRLRRFLAKDAPAGAVITVTAPGAGASVTTNPRIALIVTAVGATLLLGLAGGTFLRKPERVRTRRAASDDPDALRRELAALDTAFGELAAPSADERADHYEARARLTARLTAALARRDGLA